MPHETKCIRRHWADNVLKKKKKKKGRRTRSRVTRSEIKQFVDTVLPPCPVLHVSAEQSPQGGQRTEAAAYNHCSVVKG